MTSTAVPRSTARLRRIDLRVVIGLVLLLVGVLGTVAVIQRAGQRVPVLVMAREVPAGQVLGDQDVRVAELGLGPGVATLGVGDRGRVVGRVARGAAGRWAGPDPSSHGRRWAGAGAGAGGDECGGGTRACCGRAAASGGSGGGGGQRHPRPA